MWLPTIRTANDYGRPRACWNTWWQCASYVLAAKVIMEATKRELKVCLLLPIQGWRKRHLIKAVSKFRQRAIIRTVLSRDIEKWWVVRENNTIKPLVTYNDHHHDKRTSQIVRFRTWIKSMKNIGTQATLSHEKYQPERNLPRNTQQTSRH